VAWDPNGRSDVAPWSGPAPGPPYKVAHRPWDPSDEQRSVLSHLQAAHHARARHVWTIEDILRGGGVRLEED